MTEELSLSTFLLGSTEFDANLQEVISDVLSNSTSGSQEHSSELFAACSTCSALAHPRDVWLFCIHKKDPGALCLWFLPLSLSFLPMCLF